MRSQNTNSSEYPHRPRRWERVNIPSGKRGPAQGYRIMSSYRKNVTNAKPYRKQKNPETQRLEGKKSFTPEFATFKFTVPGTTLTVD